MVRIREWLSAGTVAALGVSEFRVHILGIALPAVYLLAAVWLVSSVTGVRRGLFGRNRTLESETIRILWVLIGLLALYALDFVRTDGDPRVMQLALKQALGCTVFLYFSMVELSPRSLVCALAAISSAIVGFYVYNSLIVLGSPYLANHLEEVTQEGRNQLAMYLAATTTVLLFALIVESSRVTRYLVLAPALVLHAMALAYSMSRGAWVAFAVSAFAGMIGARRGRGTVVVLCLASMMVVGSFVLVKGGLAVGALGDAVEALGERYQTLLAVQDAASGSSIGLRRSFVANAFEDYSSSPLLGIGAEQFLSRHQYVTHNSYLQVLVENGVIGLLLFIVPIGMVMAHSARLLSQWRRAGTTAWRLPFCLGAVAIFVEMLFVNILAGPLFFVFVGLAMNSWLGSVSSARGTGAGVGGRDRAVDRSEDQGAVSPRAGCQCLQRVR